MKLEVGNIKYGHVEGVEKPISRLVQGTVMVSSDRRDASFALLDGVFELGGNAFDTAHGYGGGDNERTVGEWVRSRGIREKVVILGKGAHPYEGRKRVTPADISQDISESLERFGFNSIDLYLLHRDDESVPVDEIVDVLDDHKRAGRIGAYGGSNWTHLRVADANAYASSNGRAPFVASSPQFGLAWWTKPPWDECVTIGGPEGLEAVSWYRENNVALFPWSSLGAGLFSGRFSRNNLDTFEDYFGKLCVECYCHEENLRRFERASKVASEIGATPAQVGLAWLFGQELEVFPLVGCATPAEFAENAKALEIRLEPEQLTFLDQG